MAVSKTLKFVLLGEDRTASKTIGGLGKEAKKTGGLLSGMGKSMKAGILGAVAAVGIGEIYDFGKAAVEASEDAAKSQRALEDAYKRFPAVQSVNIAALRAYNAELQKKTGADADDLAASQAVLARYRLTGEQLRDITPLLVDYSTRTGKELPASAGVLGKAIMGNAKAMKELGVKFKDTGDPAENLKIIMAGLRGTVGGFAEKEAKSASGQAKIMSARLGDLQEMIGEKLTPTLIGLMEKGGQVLDWLEAHPKVIKGVESAFDGLVGVIEFLSTVIGTVLGPSLEMGIRAFEQMVRWTADLLDALGQHDAADKLRGIADGARDVADGIKELGKPTPPHVPKVDNSKALARIKELKDKIASVKGRIVEAKAKGDTKEVDRLKRRLAELRSKVVTVRANVVKTGISTIRVQAMRGASDRVSVRAYAKGGRPRVGELAMFHANELWVPDTAGTVLTAAQTRRAGFGGPQPVGGGGNTYVTVQGDTDPDAAARRIEELLYRRRNRSGRLKFQ